MSRFSSTSRGYDCTDCARQSLGRESRRGRSQGGSTSPKHAGRPRQRQHGMRAAVLERTSIADPARPPVAWDGLFASSSSESDDKISLAALPPSHSHCLFTVSWLCMLSSMLCVHFKLWDVLCVPLGVGLNSVNYWRKVRPRNGTRLPCIVCACQCFCVFTCTFVLTTIPNITAMHDAA